MIKLLLLTAVAVYGVLYAVNPKKFLERRGDREITPEMLHDELFADGEDHQQPVRIILNSYGGSCNAATRMFDDIRAYPGSVKITVSGTAASAATVICMAAD